MLDENHVVPIVIDAIERSYCFMARVLRLAIKAAMGYAWGRPVVLCLIHFSPCIRAASFAAASQVFQTGEPGYGEPAQFLTVE
jgi:hypothetical protein